MNTPTIYIDSRESCKEIQELFSKQSDFKVVTQKLELGDIIFDGCLIERKTILDFYNSFRKSDMWSKIFQASDAFNKVFVWIDTTPYQTSKFYSYRNKFIFDMIEGTKVTLDSLDITWREFDKEHASDYFYRYFKKIISEKKYVPKPEVTKKGKSLLELRQQLLMSIPKVGYNSAIVLMKEYDYLGVIVNKSKNSDDKKLKEIKRIFWK